MSQPPGSDPPPELPAELASEADDDIEDALSATQGASPEALDAREFFHALHHRYDEDIAAHQGRSTLIDQVLGVAYGSFQGNVATQCADEPPLACRRGCATCCSLRITATAPEVFGIARFLRAVTPQLEARGIDLLERLRDADRHTRGLGESARAVLRRPCPFVAHGACVIYPVRPLACRGHASHDVRACADAAAGRRPDVPYSEGHRRLRGLVQNALQSALRDAELAWGLYELSQALVLCLDGLGEAADAESAWLAGDDPLDAALLPELPLAEMATGYDILRAERLQRSH